MHFFFDRSTEFLNGVQSGFFQLFVVYIPQLSCLIISPAEKIFHFSTQLTLDCILRIRPAAFLFEITFGPDKKKEMREKN